MNINKIDSTSTSRQIFFYYCYYYYYYLLYYTYNIFVTKKKKRKKRGRIEQEKREINEKRYKREWGGGDYKHEYK